MVSIGQKTSPEKLRVGGGGGCIWIIALALWSRVLRIRLVNELKCIRPDLDLDLDQELDNIFDDWDLQKNLFSTLVVKLIVKVPDARPRSCY